MYKSLLHEMTADDSDLFVERLGICFGVGLRHRQRCRRGHLQPRHRAQRRQAGEVHLDATAPRTHRGSPDGNRG